MINGMMVTIAILLIICMSLIFHSLLRITPEESFAAALMVMLIIVYISGLFGNTLISIYIVFGLALIGIICAATVPVTDTGYKPWQIFSPCIIMILFTSIFGLVCFENLQISNWDEMYQWGKAVNYMIQNDRLPSGVDFSGESLLLSSTTFMHYYISKIPMMFTGENIQSNYYVSNLVLWSSALILPFSGAQWKKIHNVIGFFVFNFLIEAVIFVQPYYNIYTDQPTAYWAGALICWIALKKYDIKNAFIIPLILIDVGLMKSMVGPLFAVIAVISIIVVYITDRKQKDLSIFPDNWKKIIFSKKGIIAIVAALSPIFLVGIWSLVVGQNALFRFNGGAVGDDRATLTVRAMTRRIFQNVTLRENKLCVSYGIFFLLVVFITFVLYPLFIEKPLKKIFKNLMVIYLIGFFAYFGIMFFAYMTVFGYTDSTRAWSLNRYFSDYIMLGVLPLFYPFFDSLSMNRRVAGIFVKVVCIALFSILTLVASSEYFMQNLTRAYALETDQYGRREVITKYADEIEEITKDEGKIYFINQTRSGRYVLAADYELDEQLSRNGMCYKFRENHDEAILGLTDYDIELWPQVIKDQNYKYIWIYTRDEYFTEEFQKLFDVEEKLVRNGAFYKIKIKKNGKIKLKYITNLKKDYEEKYGISEEWE